MIFDTGNNSVIREEFELIDVVIDLLITTVIPFVGDRVFRAISRSSSVNLRREESLSLGEPTVSFTFHARDGTVKGCSHNGKAVEMLAKN